MRQQLGRMSYECGGWGNERAERAPGDAAAVLAGLPAAGWWSAAVSVSSGELPAARLPAAAALSAAGLSAGELPSGGLPSGRVSTTWLSTSGRVSAVSRAAAPCARRPAL